MRIISIFIMLIFNQLSFSQILMKIDYGNNLLDGHNVQMVYSIENINKLYKSVNNLKKMNSERLVLQSFGLPLTNYGENECTAEKNYFDEVEKVLLSEVSCKIELKTFKYNFSIFFIKANYDICEFKLSVSHWGSYDGDFKNAGIVITKPKICKFTIDEMNIIENISKILEKIIKR